MSSSEAPICQSQNTAATKSVTWAHELSTLELRISDFDTDEDEDEETVETPIHPHPLTAFLPPLIFTSHLSAAHHASLPFPYNMSATNGIISWSLTFLLGSIFFWVQTTILSDYLSEHPRLGECRSLVALYVVVLVVEFFLGICSSLYPFVYGCVLRGREGKWPCRERVWGCEGWEADYGGDGERDVRRGARIAEYTLIGILVLGALRIVRGDDESGEVDGCGERLEEKMRLVEEGRGWGDEKFGTQETERAGYNNRRF